MKPAPSKGGGDWSFEARRARETRALASAAQSPASEGSERESWKGVCFKTSGIPLFLLLLPPFKSSGILLRPSVLPLLDTPRHFYRSLRPYLHRSTFLCLLLFNRKKEQPRLEPADYERLPISTSSSFLPQASISASTLQPRKHFYITS